MDGGTGNDAAPAPAQLPVAQAVGDRTCLLERLEDGGYDRGIGSLFAELSNWAYSGSAKLLIKQIRQEEASRASLQEREMQLRKAEETKRLAGKAGASAEEGRGGHTR